MSKIVLKIIPSLFFWGIFIFVVFQMPYPESLTQADAVQLLAFFVPLFLALSITLNLFLKNILLSFSFSLSLIFLSILQALDSLNIATATLTVVAAYLLLSYFIKAKKRSLTKLSKIPKLTRLQKREK